MPDSSPAFGESAESADMAVVQYRGNVDDVFHDNVGLFYSRP